MREPIRSMIAATSSTCSNRAIVWTAARGGVMGCGTGYAIGAALSTGKKVLYIGGDSAFGFDGMEVEVACRYQLPITFVVLNNGGIYRGDFENLGADGDPSPLTLTYNAHYEKVLEAFGGKGYYASTPEEVERMVGEAVESGKPSFVHVQIGAVCGQGIRQYRSVESEAGGRSPR